MKTNSRSKSIKPVPHIFSHPPKRGVGHIAGFQRCIFSHPQPSQVSQVHEVLSKQADLSVYYPSFQFGHSPTGVYTKVVKEVKLMAQTRGIRIHPFLDDWLLRAPSQETC